MATRYWVGGSGTWDASDTTHWSATTGGAGGASAPTAADTVNFDASSGTAAVVTVAATAVSLNTTINKSDINLSLSGSPTLCTTVGTLTLTAGTITLNDFILTVGFWSSSNTNARSIAFGTSGELRVNGSNTLVYFAPDLTNFTYTGTSKVSLTYAGATGTRVVRHGNTAGGSETTALNFNFSAGTDIVTFTATAYVKSLNFTGFSGTWSNVAVFIYGNLTVSSGMTVSAGTGALTFAATSGTQQITTNGKTLDFPITQNGVGGTLQLQDNLTMGSTRTYTLTNGTLDLNNLVLSTGLFSSNNSNTRAITFGTGKIIVTGNNAIVWQITTQTGFAPTGSKLVEFTYAGSTGTRSIFHGSGTTGNSTTALNFSVTAGTDTVDMVNTGSLYAINLNFTGFSGTLTDIRYTIYGNLTFSSGMTIVPTTGAATFAGTGVTQNITTAGLTLDFVIVFDGVGSTFVFQDALVQGSTKAFTVTNGTVKLKAGATSTVGAFATSGTNQKYLQSTLAGSQATLSQASGTANVSYLSIQDINATGGATWYSPVTQLNIDAGNNDGWDFFVQLGQYMYTRRKNKRLLIS